MSVSIKVAVRCRPFTIDDKLGVHMVQNGDEEGEINLLNSDYTTKRFAFTYSWWSAYGFGRHVTSDQEIAEGMMLMNQEAVYSQCGMKIKADLLEGNAVVLFAYGLSGSGKTFTVFGPDAPDIPEAWFKHSEPHPLWGIFPRLAYELFNEKQDGWKFTMKYFQNVVDTVRDLMSPLGEEKQYKAGMRKDEDGFMDIEWCSSKVLNSWDDLRRNFMDANAKKAIAPTQFNHQSTRGHCIMTLEVEMPNPDNPAMKQKGRVYVCDLAGTEPAGDIVYAQYEKKVFPNGEIEHHYIGPHNDQKKTKELQAQGMKINLSLSEMAQFFMKMAEAVLAKKLKPGVSIPGCNSYFLCKYLKDTMLQARTYLFCAIRPEVTYLNYTFSTLGFAKNASVVKLQPKKAMVAASPAERKLMEELEAMKAMFAKLQEEHDKISKAGGGEGADVGALQAMLLSKQNELKNVLEGGAGDVSSSSPGEDMMMLQQKEEYGRRGISLSHFEKDTVLPHFINLDEDPFRSNRFVYLLQRPRTDFGPNGHIKPMALAVVRDHCAVIIDEAGGLFLEGGKGTTYHNGTEVDEGVKVPLAPYDRIAIGGELLLFIHPGHAPEGVEPPTAELAVEELQKGLQSKDKKAQEMLEQRMREFEEEKAKWGQKREKALAAGEAFEAEEPTMDEEKERAWQMVDREILDLLPKTKEAKSLVKLMDRDTLSFDVALQRMEDSLGVPKVKVKVENVGPDGTNSLLLDPMDFLRDLSVLKDELVHLRSAKDNSREYTVDPLHDPVRLLFDNTFKFGTSMLFPEFLLYNLPTEPEEKDLDIKLVSAAYDNVGALEVTWTPLAGPDDPGTGTVRDIDDIDTDLVNKPWTYRINIKRATILPIMVSSCFVQYDFFGQLYTTETIEADTHAPVLDYSFIHHIPRVTPEFIQFLKRPLQFNVWVSPFISNPRNPVSTLNPAVLPGVGSLNPMSPMATGVLRGTFILPRTENGVELAPEDVNASLTHVLVDRKEYETLQAELTAAKGRIVSLEAEIQALKNGQSSVSSVVVNGEAPAAAVPKLSSIIVTDGAEEARSSPRLKLNAAKEMDEQLNKAIEAQEASQDKPA